MGPNYIARATRSSSRLDVLRGAAGNFNAGRGGAGLVVGDAIAATAEKVRDDLGGLEGIDA